MRLFVLALLMLVLLVTPISITPRASAADPGKKTSLKQDVDSGKKGEDNDEGESETRIAVKD
jgi:hypothetical protein